MKRIILTICTGLAAMMAAAQSNPASVNLAEATIVYNEADASLVKQMAQVLADDIERTLKGTWERYAIDTKDDNGPAQVCENIFHGQIIQKITYQF